MGTFSFSSLFSQLESAACGMLKSNINQVESGAINNINQTNTGGYGPTVNQTATQSGRLSVYTTPPRLLFRVCLPR